MPVLSASSPSDLMNAIIVEGGTGDASMLKLTRISAPQPKPGELMMRVRAAGVNAPDLMQRSGRYPPPPGASHILGLEVAGEVVTAAGRWRVGDRVCALLGGGGYAVYAVCDPRHALPSRQGSTGAKPPRCPRPRSPSTPMSSYMAASSPARRC